MFLEPQSNVLPLNYASIKLLHGCFKANFSHKLVLLMGLEPTFPTLRVSCSIPVKLQQVELAADKFPNMF